MDPALMDLAPMDPALMDLALMDPALMARVRLAHLARGLGSPKRWVSAPVGLSVIGLGALALGVAEGAFVEYC